MKKSFITSFLISFLFVTNISFAEEPVYDNYYVDYVYNNYLKDKERKSITIVKTTAPVNQNSQYFIQPQNNDELQANTENLSEDDSTQESDNVNSQSYENSQFDENSSNQSKYNFYTELGIGISQLRDFFVTQPAYSMDKATMEPERSSNYSLKFGFNDLLANNLNLELELGYVNNDRITTNNENKVILLDYNQKIKTYNVGTNIIYNFGNIDNLFIPFVGFGIGISKFDISDYGTVLAKDGIVDQSGQPTYFESESESKNVFYGKASAGILYSMNDNTKFSLSADYIIYNDFDITFLDFEDLNRINVVAGLRFYF